MLASARSASKRRKKACHETKVTNRSRHLVARRGTHRGAGRNTTLRTTHKRKTAASAVPTDPFRAAARGMADVMAPVRVQIQPLINGAAIVSITATAVSPQAKPVAHAGHTEASRGPYAVKIRCTDERLRSIVVSIEGPGTGESISGNNAVAVDVPVAPSMLDAQPAVTGSQNAASSVSGEDLISTASKIVSSIVSAASSLIMPKIEIPGSADWFFSRADADNNGNIDVAELRAVFDEQGVSEVDIDELFEKCSSNGDLEILEYHDLHIPDRNKFP